MSRIRNFAFDAALGARIREARTSAGLSQGALGERLGISFQQVQKYETGRDQIRVEMLLAAAAALGTPPADLLDADLIALAQSAAEPAPDHSPAAMNEAA